MTAPGFRDRDSISDRVSFRGSVGVHCQARASVADPAAVPAAAPDATGDCAFDVDDLLAEHVEDYRALYDRFTLDIGESSAETLALPTDKRLAAYKEGGIDPDLLSANKRIVNAAMELMGAGAGFFTLPVANRVARVIAVEADGHEITTVEGIEHDGLTSLQRTLIDLNSFQCGFCAPGIVLAAAELLEDNPTTTIWQRHRHRPALEDRRRLVDSP